MIGPEAVFALIANEPGSVWLDGGESEPSLISFDPLEIFTDGANWPTEGRALTRRGQGHGFEGGCIGYIGYGAGHRVAPVPAEAPSQEPEVWLGRFEGALRWLPDEQRWEVAGSSSFRKRAQGLLDSAVELGATPTGPTVNVYDTTSQLAFEQRVDLIRRLNAAGDCYQVNLTRPILAKGVGAPWPAYRRLRSLSAASRGAFLSLGDNISILSNSPECFLDVRGDLAWSIPIKGTRPRGHDAETDLAWHEELLNAPKDLAELTMIVDLVRNDLHRIASRGSVSTGARVITPHANVHHASQRVSCRLKTGRDPWDALAATFPPGSVTGAPKIRAAQRISELETGPRGVYCGAIGYVADGGESAWSVAIRTASWRHNTVRFHVGGGIVIDSNPTDEWWETEHKATVMRAAFLGHGFPTPRSK